MEKNGSELDLPGFRFHPTEEELLEFYLRRATAGKKLNFDIIGTLNLYLYDPWDLPALAKMGEREWYFFVPRDRRQANGGRPNRTTERGFWKATGSDRPIRSAANPRRLIGLKKTLVFYRGRAPHGNKTDWVMNEYRLPDVLPFPTSLSVPQPPKEDIVLCKIYRKATSQKELEQRAAMEASRASQGCTVSATSSDQENLQKISFDNNEVIMDMKVEFELPPFEFNKEVAEVSSAETQPPIMPLLESSADIEWSALQPEPSVMRPPASPASKTPAVRQLPSLPALQVPNHMSFDLVQDSFLSQLRSPWLDQWSPLYASLLNF
ncbi:NAC domain-containing protein 22 [Dendrobium catenatum]|uniref:NAC domain-containing protein 94 n=1 Tax=Dendrobium catenatum TaxID=906689 RepID=A0A2I0V748_9ASPA|nr:NAC domain-containing protein 22 [Dendrobium catenatum]PKU59230.1 Putative NAC domain-containing protein 94 [Dendrobium catenatum]